VMPGRGYNSSSSSKWQSHDAPILRARRRASAAFVSCATRERSGGERRGAGWSGGARRGAEGRGVERRGAGWRGVRVERRRAEEESKVRNEEESTKEERGEPRKRKERTTGRLKRVSFHPGLAPNPTLVAHHPPRAAQRPPRRARAGAVAHASRPPEAKRFELLLGPGRRER
jgi:hypothetical protein